MRRIPLAVAAFFCAVAASQSAEWSETALLDAARRGDAPAVRNIVGASSNPDLRLHGGPTALMVAARHGHEELVRFLLEAGADVRLATSIGSTALLEAVAGHQTSIAQLLIDAGADLRAQHRECGTALDLAQRRQYGDLVALLRAQGAPSSGRTVGDTVCSERWGGDGYCGVIEAIDGNRYKIRITNIHGCQNGCSANVDCSDGRPIDAMANGALRSDERIWVGDWCLTRTAVDELQPPAAVRPDRLPSASTIDCSRSAEIFPCSGIIHVSFWHDEYLYPEAKASRIEASELGARYAAVLVTWYMPRSTASTVAPDPEKTPTDSALIEAIRHLHELGLKVMLKPHVDVQDGTWRGTILPSDSAAWFPSYKAFIQKYARLAEANGVELFSIGTELKTMSTTTYLNEWLDLIQAVRVEYRGALTYAANAVVPLDEFTSVPFWSYVDVAGLDAYVRLTRTNDPTERELIDAWYHNAYEEHPIANFANWQMSHGMPVILTELGYRSVDGANQAPYDASLQGAYDPEEQAALYDAAFTVWSRQPWAKGIFWWNWPVPTPKDTDTDYSPRSPKPAADILKIWYRTKLKAPAPSRRRAVRH